MKKPILLIIAFLSLSVLGFAKDKKDAKAKPKIHKETVARIASDCSDPTSRAILDINNVRTTILGGNDMWWDQSSAAYEIPKISDENELRKHSLFAGSVWIGGIDAGKVLKVAAQTYRSSALGVGFWPGPLIQGDAITEENTCIAYNRHWKVERALIDELRAATEEDPGNPGTFIVDQDFLDNNIGALKDVLEWPGNADPRWKHQESQFAPYVDVDADGVYNPLVGDYPQIRGDQSIWFVTNDAGNTPGSGSESIGMEIQTEAFAFFSNDELNNMTFYGNKIVNRSTIRLDSCFMSQWVDPDLGENSDDYLACDVPRGLGICFNGDDDDEGNAGYGSNPPAVGVDFFEGPFSDPFDSIDNDRDCLVDEIDVFGCDEEAKTERAIMSKFMYFDRLNGFPLTDPSNAQEAYNFMIGRWADGIPLTYGGSGRGGAEVSEMAFPEETDLTVGWSRNANCQNPNPFGTSWSEVNAGNDPGDRRFVQSGGPFTLEPGAVNYITIGVVWARASSGGPRGSFDQLRRADTKAQALFENCFEVLNGPDAPDLDIVELDQELIINMVFKPTSNNYKMLYNEIDPQVKALNNANPPPDPLFDETYNFQGILLYQLADSKVSNSELDDLNRARLIYQVDLEDDVTRIINYEADLELGIDVPTAHPTIANNNGVDLTLQLTTDAFTTLRMVNNRQYHFLAVCYGYNNYQTYDLVTKEGQAKPYLPGRRNVKITSAIPHKVDPEFGGLVLNSKYGDGPDITRLEGTGNGGNALDLTDETVNQILAPPYFVEQPVYRGGNAPVNIKVIDPKKVPMIDDFTMSFYPGRGKLGQNGTITDTARWFMTYNGTSDTIYSDTIIDFGVEQVLLGNGRENLGLSVTIENKVDPGTINADDESIDNNGFIDGSIEYLNGGLPWLNFLADVGDGVATAEVNWIRGGPQNDENLIGGDPEEIYEGVINGTWAPYRLVRWGTNSPAIQGLNPSQRPLPSLQSLLRDTRSVDLVITSDKSKWTRCVVLEMGENSALNVGAQDKSRIRTTPSIDEDGNNVSTGQFDVGLGWFPGYAINVETGERLNICFGEESSNAANNGDDLLWNPTDSARFDNQGLIENWGGKHHIFIMKSRYDAGAAGQLTLTKNGTTTSIPNSLDGALRLFYGQVMWVAQPALLRGSTMLSSDVKVRLRTTRAYGKDNIIGSPTNFNNPKFMFGTSNLAPTFNDEETAKSALDLVNVVPNPYYAYSDKETQAADSRVRITNLPQTCVIKIYALNGVLIRTLSKDDPSTFIDWDLKNQVRVPIAGGTYIIHVDAGSLGETAVKWFGVLRPVDLDAF